MLFSPRGQYTGQCVRRFVYIKDERGRGLSSKVCGNRVGAMSFALKSFWETEEVVLIIIRGRTTPTSTRPQPYCFPRDEKNPARKERSEI